METVIKYESTSSSITPKHHSRSQVRYAIHARAISLALLLILAWHYLYSWNLQRVGDSQLEGLSTASQGKRWDWSDVTPSKSLDWEPCYEGFDCARLDVPLDWLDPTDEDRVVLAVIRLPAVNRTDYRGPVFMNPGGPGGSGIYSLRDHGRQLQTIIGNNHDIISWDPRGVGVSTPQIDCWTSPQRSQLWNMRQVGVIDSHPGVLYDAFARAVSYSQACTAAMPGPKSLLKFVSTASAARDMLEILEKTGFPKLKYWGFSYGTVLGVTFASMFPDKVDLMINDGNVDVVDWTSDGHIHFLADADNVMAAFWKFCHAAGPEGCALYSSTPTAIQTRFENVVENLKVHPVIVSSGVEGLDLPEIVTYSSIKRLISAALYRPVLMYPSLAQIIAALEAGDGRPYVEYTLTHGMRQPFSCSCGTEDSPLDVESNNDAFPGIMCSDSGIRIESVEKFESYANYMMDVSKASGAVQVLFEMSCAGRDIRPKWRFNGPFTANTTNPLLFLANIADNVTPYRSAVSNARGFNNSVILVQESYGHTSLTAPSTCTASHVRAYFQHAVVPAAGTKCKADIDPFHDLQKHMSATGVDNSELTTALVHLTKNFRVSLPSA